MARRIAGRSMLILVGFGFALCISILADRIYGWYLIRTNYFTALTPNVTEVYETNEFSVIATTSAQGLRNPIISKTKPDGVFRILALGDSFTYGWGVAEEEAWPRILERELTARGKKVEVINAGAPGISLRREWLICRSYAPRFDVDLIILALYGRDDLYQVAQYEEATGFKEKFARDTWPWFSYGRNPTIVTSWHGAPPGVTVNAKDRWKIIARGLTKQFPGMLDSLSTLVRDDFMEGRVVPTFTGVGSGDPYYPIRLLKPDNLLFSLRPAEEWLRKIASCAGNRPLVMLTIPSSTAISKEFHAYRQGLGFVVDQELLTFDLDTYLRPVAQRYGFTYVSLLQPFRKEACVDCYYHWDMHFTPLGHERAAGYLLPFLYTIF